MSTASNASDNRSSVTGRTAPSDPARAPSDGFPTTVATADGDSLPGDVSAWPARQDHHGIARAPCFRASPQGPTHIGEYSYKYRVLDPRHDGTRLEDG
ncbi:hypothetical protein GCM10009557_15610 [Virgisporangium ochraceum]